MSSAGSKATRYLVNPDEDVGLPGLRHEGRRPMPKAI